MKSRWSFAWVYLGLAASGCSEPRIVPVMPPGVGTPKVAPPTAGGGAEALGETANRSSAQPTVSTIISEPTPVGQEKKTASGLVYITTKEGTGPQAKPGQTVKVHYVSHLEDGTKFDSSRDRGEPSEFQIGLSRVMKGWDEGVPGMKVGETRRLIVPGHLAYGANGQPGVVPPNATVVFDVELLDVK